MTTVQDNLDFIEELKQKALERFEAGIYTIEEYHNYLDTLAVKEAEFIADRDSKLKGDAKIIDFFITPIKETLVDIITGIGEIGTGSLSGFKSLGFIIPFLLISIILLPIVLPAVMGKR